MFSEKLSRSSQNIDRSNEGGTSMVEFAIVLPLLLLVVFGMIEFGILIYDKAVITNASREGARYGIENRATRWTEAQIQGHVNDYCTDHLISFQSASPSTSVTTDKGTKLCGAFGDYLTVAVQYQYTFLILPKLGSIPNSILLNAQTTMRCE